MQLSLKRRSSSIITTPLPTDLYRLVRMPIPTDTPRMIHGPLIYGSRKSEK